MLRQDVRSSSAYFTRRSPSTIDTASVPSRIIQAIHVCVGVGQWESIEVRPLLFTHPDNLTYSLPSLNWLPRSTVSPIV